MPRKALRCCVELEIQAVTCPGVYLPRRDDVYISISLFKEHRRTRLVPPSFPLLFHQRFGFDKVFYTAFQPQQVSDALETSYVIIELVQLSDILEHGRLLARYECNAKDFLYPYPEYTINYGSTDRNVLMNRTMEFPGIAPKLEFSTKTVLKEVERPVLDPMHDVHLIHDSMMKQRARSSRSPRRSHSMTRLRSKKRSSPGKSKQVSYRHRRPTIASISHSRSPSPGVARKLENMSLRDSLIDDDNKPPFVVRKVESGLIGRHPGTRHPCPHKLRRSKSRSPPRHTTVGGVDSYLDEDYRLVGSRPWYSYSHKPLRDSYYSSYSLSEMDDSSDVLSDVSDPGPVIYRSTSRPISAYSYQRQRSPSPVTLRQSLRERFEDDNLSRSIASRVDEALQRNRSRERRSREQQRRRSSSRGAINYYDEDFDKIRDLERDLEIARNRSLVHVNDGEYWTQRASEYKGQSHRELFNNNLGKVYSDMYSKAKKFDDRVY